LGFKVKENMRRKGEFLGYTDLYSLFVFSNSHHLFDIGDFEYYEPEGFADGTIIPWGHSYVKMKAGQKEKEVYELD